MMMVVVIIVRIVLCILGSAFVQLGGIRLSGQAENPGCSSQGNH